MNLSELKTETSLKEPVVLDQKALDRMITMLELQGWEFKYLNGVYSSARNIQPIYNVTA